MTAIPAHIDLDIIQPCYNPLPGWEDSVLTHFNQLKALLPGVVINLVIVNDGSTKNVDEAHVQWLKENIQHFEFIGYPVNRGKGYALRCGVAAGKGPLQIYTDIDFPFELPHIPEIYALLKNGDADIVSGVRSQDYYGTLSPQRFLASRTSQLLNNLFLKLPFNDTQSGIKGFNAKGREVFMRTTIDRYLADTEFLALAAKTGKLRIVPMEVMLRADVHLSKMNFKTFMRELRNFAKVYSIVFKSRS